jgi:hypothetical protein
MNLDTLWQQHRRFLTGILIGLILFFIGKAIIKSTVLTDYKRAETKVKAMKIKLRGSSYTAAQVLHLEKHLAELKDRSNALAAVTLAPLRSSFSPAPSQSPGQHYIQWTGQLRDDLIAFALRNNVDVEDSLGIPAQQPAQVNQMERVMRGLDVIDRVVRMAVLAGASQIDDIEIRMRSERRRGRAMANQALDLVPVSLTVIFKRNPVLPFTRMVLEEVDHLGPLGLSRLEVEEEHPRKNQRRVILEFSVGGMPRGEAE